MPAVYNRRNKDAPPDAVYVGRPTKWGNPFSVARWGRDQAIAKYRAWLQDRIWAGNRDPEELRGKDLVCWCKPAPCHADILLEVANA